MSYLRAAAIVLCVLTASAAVQAQPKPAAAAVAPQMKPGLWEIIVMHEIVGSTNRRSTTSRVCFSADDVKSLDKIIPPQREFGSKCDRRDVKVQGDNVTWHIACTGKESSFTGASQAAFTGDAYSGSAKLDVKTGGKTSKAEQKFSGKWISECK